MAETVDSSQHAFLRFAAGVLGVDPAGLTLETSATALPAWDSIMHLRLAMELESRYGLSIPFETVPELKTLGDFYRYLPH